MAKSIEEAVKWMENIARDDSHGYDQAHRNGPNYDCSSLVGTALSKAGFNVSPSSTTRNLYEQLKKEGFVSCSKPWKRGDIHLSVGHHVVTSIDANNIVHASINEKGTATGGKSGDQTGKEICIRSYYEYPKGWTYHLRYVGANTSSNSGNSSSGSNYYVVRQGDTLTRIADKYNTTIDALVKLNNLKDKNLIRIGQKIYYKSSQSNSSINNYSTLLSGYKGSSIVDAFKSKKIDSSFASRKKYAEAVGIKNYKGTKEQNAKLLKLLGAN